MNFSRARRRHPAHARPRVARRRGRGGLVVLCAYVAVIGVTEVRLQSRVSAITSVEMAPSPIGDLDVVGAS